MAKINHLTETELRKTIKQVLKGIESDNITKEYQSAIGDGIYLIIELNGRVYFRIRPTLNGKRTWLNLSTYDELSFNLRELKFNATKLLKEVKSPSAKSNIDSSDIITINELCDSYLQVVTLIRKTKDSQMSLIYSINTIKNQLGDVKIRELTTEMVETYILKPKALTIPAMKKDFKILRQLFDYALDKRCVEENIVRDMRSHLLKVTHNPKRLVINETDLKKLFKGLYELDRIPFKFKVAIHLLFLLMTRRMELLSAKWSQVDLESKNFTIEQNKTEAPTVVPLSSHAIKLFEIIKANTKCFGSCSHEDYIFKGARRVGHVCPISINRHFEVLSEFLGKKVTPHATRRTASTILHKMRFDMAVIESALNHSKKNLDSMWAIYNRHDYYDERKKMLQVWADEINGYINIKFRSVMV